MPWKTTLLALAAALIAPAAAGAATTVGQSPPAAGTPQLGCTVPPGQAVDTVQLSNTTGNSYAVPAGGGVITSWRTSTTTGSAQVKLRLFRTEGPLIVPLAESSVENLTPASTSFATRIPVSGGELLGFTVLPSAAFSNCVNRNTGGAGDIAAQSATSAPIGQSEPAMVSPPQVLLNVAATLEPDADKDGYGDETQDGCPTDAATQGPCPKIDNAFTIGKRKLNKQRGTAKITVDVPSAGVLKLSGKNVATARVEKAAAGNAKLTLKPKGKLKKKLKVKGKAKAKVTIAFTPTGGETAKQKTSVKLRRRG